MPRWLLAVFVLQLLWNLAGFPAAGQPHEHAQADGPSMTVSGADTPLPAVWGPGTAANGLLDELPDLPDTLLRRGSPKSSAAPTPAHTDGLQTGAPDALLDALFRPPPQA